MTPRDFLLVEDVAETLGVAVSTVHEWAARNQMPCRRLPGRRRLFIPREDFLAWMDGAELDVKHLAGGGRVVKPRRPR